ncbi:MAG TPA: ATP-binding protein [Bacteroidetes bacterium]|nr:ATP-binding protein [Bacteroidota bacterium]
MQRKENAGLFLKGVYDLNLPYKLIISGSGSLELKANIQESLTGRKRLFRLFPVSFEEFLQYHTEYKYEDRLPEFLAVEGEHVRFLLEEYLQFGGYPRIVTEARLDEKKLLMDEIFHSYLEKDIVYLLKVDRPEIFVHLIRLLAVHSGKLVNYSHLASSLGIAVRTLKKYLWYAENTFIIQMVTPFYRNIKKEITKSPTVYFVDLGLRNFALGRFGNLVAVSENGFAFQNFVFNLLQEKADKLGGRLHSWRTKERAEVDFVLEKVDEVIPIGIKYASLKKISILRSMRTFIEKYQPKSAWVVNLSLDTTSELNHTKIHFIPYFKLLFSGSS